jgi:AcrR family transcriptional regulator
VSLDTEARRDLILDAVQAVFDAAGMSGVTMAAVARAAGMSKRTLYAMFDDRAALLEAYSGRHLSRIVVPLTPEEAAMPLDRRLRRLLAPRAATRSLALPFAILRTIIAEAHERPDMAARVFRSGLPRIRALIQEELDRAVDRGEARIPDTAAAAALLADMARPSPLDRLVDPDRPFDMAAVEARFELGLDIFLRGIGFPVAAQPGATPRGAGGGQATGA